jgi:cell fate regulator YaaT (PSP1 superfamily)
MASNEITGNEDETNTPALSPTPGDSSFQALESSPEPRRVVTEAAPQYVVRTGAVRSLSVMQASRSHRYGDRVIVKTERGTEFGVVLCEATPAAMSHLEEPTSGRILRAMSADDERQWQVQQTKSGDDSLLCARFVKELSLDMQVVDVERIFGGERVVFYFIAEKRVDFRNLVKKLADELKTRIEMRQIGVRDEAKLLADYGDCGKPVCCNTHLTKMPPVSMRMAKLQKATLDPSKISGRCGRLKCCLRYEFDTYEELQRDMPPVGSRIVTADGAATVMGQEILSQQLLVQTEDNRRILIAAATVLAVTRRGTGKPERRGRDRDDETE